VTGLTKGQLAWLRKHKINPHSFAGVAKFARASGVVIPEDPEEYARVLDHLGDEMGEDST
jgi:hypothetical protein